MKKKLAYFVAALAISVAATVSASFVTTANPLDPSCNGKCKRAYNACINGGNNPPSCNASYQGCISSCK
ncbi:MAG TPA: hypothetical protein VJS44_20090 [Pyrinomonadaceae bacterium]|nr:hypothetical protein [Pyrinomonadaceae bacterium]